MADSKNTPKIKSDRDDNDISSTDNTMPFPNLMTVPPTSLPQLPLPIQPQQNKNYLSYFPESLTSCFSLLTKDCTLDNKNSSIKINDINFPNKASSMQKKFDHLNLQLKTFKTENKFTPDMFNFRETLLKDKQYSVTPIEQIFSGNPGLGKRFTCLIHRNGHIVEKPVLFIKTNDDDADVTPEDIIDNIYLDIGGQSFDKIHGSNLLILLKMYGLKWTKGPGYMAIPLPFDLFYGKNTLPIDAIQFHEIRINIQLNDYHTAGVDINYFEEAYLRCDYIWIDQKVKDNTLYEIVKDKLSTFVYGKKEYPEYKYVFRQSQFTGEEQVTSKTAMKYSLYFNHPMQYIYFYFTKKIDSNKYEKVTNKVIKNYVLQINGCDYINQPGESLLHDSKSIIGMPGVYVIAISKEKIQDYCKDTLNFSDIDRMQLTFTFAENAFEESIDKYFFNVYGVSQNVVDIKDGKCNLMYEN